LVSFTLSLTYLYKSQSLFSYLYSLIYLFIRVLGLPTLLVQTSKFYAENIICVYTEYRKLLDDLKERRGYSHLKKEALDCTMWRVGFGRGFGPVVRQTAK
jgi:hypothetical protein